MRTIFLLLTASCFFSCSRDDLNNPNPGSGNRLLAQFTVTVVDRAPNTAIITWTEATNPFNQDTVKYDITLNGVIKVQGLKRTIDTLMNLSPDSLYTGKVFAHTASGDTASASFVLEKSGGFIFFGDFNGSLYCYDVYSGNRAWKTPSTTYRYEGIPTIENDVMYCNSKGEGIWAFNAKTGATIWHNRFGLPVGDYGAISSSTPIYQNGKIFTVFEKIYGLNSATGQTEWTYTEPGNNNLFIANPVVDNNLLFIHVNGYQRKLIAINTTNGTKVWEYLTNCNISKSPVVYNGLVIFGGSDAKIYAINQATGLLAWSRDFSAMYSSFGADYISPRMYKNLVIVQCPNSGYYALNALSGATVWNFVDASTPNISSPAIGNNMVYFAMRGVSNSKAVALNAATGAKIWEHEFGYTIDWPTPVFAKNRLYFGNNLTWGYGIQILNATTGSSFGVLAPNVYQGGGETIVSGDSTFYISHSGMVQ